MSKKICVKAVRYGYMCGRISGADKYFTKTSDIVEVDALCLNANRRYCKAKFKCRPVKITIEFIKEIPTK